MVHLNEGSFIGYSTFRCEPIKLSGSHTSKSLFFSLLYSSFRTFSSMIGSSYLGNLSLDWWDYPFTMTSRLSCAYKSWKYKATNKIIRMYHYTLTFIDTHGPLERGKFHWVLNFQMWVNKVVLQPHFQIPLSFSLLDLFQDISSMMDSSYLGNLPTYIYTI